MKEGINKHGRVVGEAFYGYGIALWPVTPADLPSLRRWRNSPKISEIMKDTSHISPHKQRRWFEGIRGKADQEHWVVWREGVRTGYMKIKGAVKGERLELQEQIEVGAYVGDSAVRYGLLGYSVILMQLSIVFEYLPTFTILSEIKESNIRGRELNRQLGYSEESSKKGIIVLSNNRTKFRTVKKKLARYFDDPVCRTIRTP